ncbi:CD81 antigen-like [Branchiostoma floridae]|uniref:Tetraspanin n=1 Tax=Branchiostoma floridae TaxID=7739 RepID=A0A9J7L2F8_BRAFL|nr:CD81 antigen-like [Branchiostoma floridae]
MSSGDLSGGMKCLKYLLFLFNLIFWIAGVGLIGVGIWVLVDTGTYNVLKLAEVNTLMLYLGGYVLIGAGMVTMIVGFLGCFGAVKENTCLLGTFFICLLLLLCLEIGIGIYSAVQRDQFYGVIEKAMDGLSKTNYGDRDQASRSVIDFVQKNLECCGMNSTTNWDPKPASCACTKTVSYCSASGNSTTTNWSRPCDVQVRMFLMDSAVIIIGVACGIGAILVLGMILSCCIIRSKGGSSDVV